MSGLIADSDFLESVNQRIEPYHIRERLGSGGVGEIFLAESPQHKELIAVKALKEDIQDQQLIQRFRLEFDLLKRMDHPSLTKVYEYHVAGRPFFTMEHVAGKDLKEAFEITSTGQKADTEKLEKVIDACYQLLDALKYLHEKKIIHRDLKPENIMYLWDGQVKLLDFGIARDMDSNLNLTQHHEVLGTFEFIAPEILAGNVYDHRIDFYSLGAFLYQMISGQRMFRVNTLVQMFEVKRNSESPQLDPKDWPEHAWFIQVVNTLIQHKPNNRFLHAYQILELFRDNWQSKRLASLEKTQQTGIYPLLSIRSLPLVGRDQTLQEVRAWIGSGNYLPALLHGPTGVGKSRLASQLHTECTHRGLPSVLFDSHSIDAEARFFQNVLSTLRSHFFPDKPDVNDIFIGKGGRGPGLTPTQFSFYVGGSVKAKPVVLIFDDLHLFPSHVYHEILQFFLLERTRQSELCVKWIFLFNDELTSSMEIRSGALLSDLLPVGLDLGIEPLDRDEVHQLVRLLLGGANVGNSIVDEAHTFSNGLPYAVADLLDVFLDKEILRLKDDCWCLDYGDGDEDEASSLPSNIAEQVLADQFEKLDVLSIELLKILAVGGTKTPIGVVKTALQVGQDDLDRVVNELIIDQLIDTDGKMLSFVNPTMQKHFLSTLSEEELREAHFKVMMVLEGLHPEDKISHLFELLKHASLAGDPDRSFKYGVRVGAFFFKNDMFEEAQQYMGHAITSYLDKPRMSLFEAHLWKAESAFCLFRLQEAAAEFKIALGMLDEIKFENVRNAEAHADMFRRIIYHKLALLEFRRSRLGDAYDNLRNVSDIHERLREVYFKAVDIDALFECYQKDWVEGRTPSQVLSREVHQFHKLVFDTLVEQDDRGVFVGRLAKSWTWHRPTRTLTFELNRGLTYHNGALLRADDVVFSFNLIRDQKFMNPVSSHGMSRIESISAPEQGVVKVVYHPGPVPNMVFWSQLLIVPGYVYGHSTQHAVTDEKKRLLGSGPYQFVYGDETSRVFTRKEGSKARVRRINLRHDSYNLLEELQKGGVHFAYLDHQKWRRIDPKMQIKYGIIRDSYVSNQSYRLCFKLNHMRTLSLRIRQAIYDHLQLETWIKHYLDNQFVVTRGSILATQSTVGVHTIFKTAKEKLAEALRLEGWEMSEEGYWHKRGELLTFNLLVPEIKEIRKCLKAMIHNWRDFGIRVKVAWREISSYRQYVSSDKVNCWVDYLFIDPQYEGLGDFLHSDCIPYGANHTGYSSEKMDSLIEQLQSTYIGQRKNLRVRIDDLFFKELPWIPLFQPKLYYAFNAQLGGIHPSARGVFKYQRDYENLYQL